MATAAAFVPLARPAALGSAAVAASPAAAPRVGQLPGTDVASQPGALGAAQRGEGRAALAGLAMAAATRVFNRRFAKRPMRRAKAASPTALRADSRAIVDNFLSYVGKTGSPAHSVEEAKKILRAAGFEEIDSRRKWQMKPGGKYFVTSQGTSICVFAVGGQFSTEEGGVLLAAGHTDSPCLKVRPCSKLPSKAGTLQLGVDTYGGGLWHTWFDRPLGVAGTVLVSSTEGGQRKVEERLVRLDEPLCVIPNLAIHLQSADERKAFEVKRETQLRPVLCSTPWGGRGKGSAEDTASAERQELTEAVLGKHPGELLSRVAEACGVEVKDILDVDLCLMDVVCTEEDS
eukprot:TRINITY_DN17289_c0_g1_i1.p1 TRINITY_DN17289_c0_g1~~TRINITY_DN17289_c0_g1_i1.p1  ORF type:complete len:366 (+),score=75.52 TRINITY_DN17289_c0_g1_i1:64-1098(+)